MTNNSNQPLRPGRYATLQAYLELVRLPNIFTAVADVAMGFLFVQAVAGPRDACTLALLVATTSLLYASGVVLNDLFDFQLDVQLRPQRPLPAGRVSRRLAAWLGWELLILGAALAWLVALVAGQLRPGVVGSLLVGSIVLYDALLKKTPLGPIVMGGCRMLNVLLGMSVAAVSLQAMHWLVAGGVGTYIAGVTWFARTEAHQSNRLCLALATAVMMVGIGLLASFVNWCPDLADPAADFSFGRWYLLMGVCGALIAWRCLQAVIQPSPVQVQVAVELSILSLVILDAAVCYVRQGPLCGVIILLLLLPAVFLGRRIHCT